VALQVDAGELRDDGPREVVVGGAEAAGDDHDVRAAARVAEHGEHALDVVADGRVAVDVDADLREPCRDPRGVRVDALAEQQLGADRDELSLHGSTAPP
jgi:hypothetical protein